MYTTAKKVIETIEMIAMRREPAILPAGILRCRDLTLQQCNSIFGVLYSDLIAFAYGPLHSCNQPEDVVYSTVYNRSCHTKKLQKQGGTGGDDD